MEITFKKKNEKKLEKYLKKIEKELKNDAKQCYKEGRNDKPGTSSNKRVLLRAAD